MIGFKEFNFVIDTLLFSYKYTYHIRKFKEFEPFS